MNCRLPFRQISPGISAGEAGKLMAYRKGGIDMRSDCALLFGLGAGLTAGTMIGMMLPVGRTPMRTKMGKRIQKMGIAVDHTMDDILSNLR